MKKTFVIQRGGRYSWPLFIKTHSGKQEQNFSVRFSRSCSVWCLEDKEEDWSKLVGWSFGYHKRDSIRVVWRPSKNVGMIDVALYKYQDWKMTSSKKFITVPVETEIFCQVCRDSSGDWNLMTNFDVEVNHGAIAAKIDAICFMGHPAKTIEKWGYFLRPYYGGTFANPLKLKIDLELL